MGSKVSTGAPHHPQNTATSPCDPTAAAAATTAAASSSSSDDANSRRKRWRKALSWRRTTSTSHHHHPHSTSASSGGDSGGEESGGAGGGSGSWFRSNRRKLFSSRKSATLNFSNMMMQKQQEQQDSKQTTTIAMNGETSNTTISPSTTERAIPQETITTTTKNTHQQTIDQQQQQADQDILIMSNISTTDNNNNESWDVVFEKLDNGGSSEASPSTPLRAKPTNLGCSRRGTPKDSKLIAEELHSAEKRRRSHLEDVREKAVANLKKVDEVKKVKEQFLRNHIAEKRRQHEEKLNNSQMLRTKVLSEITQKAHRFNEAVEAFSPRSANDRTTLNSSFESAQLAREELMRERREKLSRHWEHVCEVRNSVKGTRQHSGGEGCEEVGGTVQTSVSEKEN